MEVKMKNIWLIAFLILVVLISGCTGQKTEPQPSTTDKVDIIGFAFDPANIAITKGTNVTWTNKDSAQHTVTEINNAFSSGTLNQGQTYTHIFNESGTYEYQCHIHPNMKGKVIVS
jgi:plastocyanin